MAGGLTTAQLATARAMQRAIMDKTATVTSPGTPTANAYGGEDPGTPTTATVPCRVAPPTATDQRTAERLGIVVDAIVTLPFDTAISSKCTITVGTTAYDVGYENTEESYLTAVRAFCRTARS